MEKTRTVRIRKEKAWKENSREPEGRSLGRRARVRVSDEMAWDGPGV